jgi:hypothetical protein
MRRRDAVELTASTKSNGPLTKRILLGPDGTVKSDGPACLMASGTAERVLVNDVGQLALMIDKMR